MALNIMDSLLAGSLNVNDRSADVREMFKERLGEAIADTASDGHCFPGCYHVIEDLTARDDVIIK